MTPTVITDRNGKVTTVHRRDSVSQHPSVILPAPMAAPAPVIRDKIMKYVDEQLQLHYGSKQEQDAMRVAKQLLQYPAGLLADLENTLRTHEASRRVITVMLQNNMSESSIHEAAVFLPKIWSGIPSESYSHVQALHYYEELPQHENYAIADDAVKKQCIALINVSIALDGSSDVIADSPLHWEGDELSPVIRDSKLVHLVIDNPDKAPMIAKFIEERLSVDYAALTELVNAESYSLSRGFL